jgi:hypothetical protein
MAIASFFVPRIGQRGYILYNDGFISDFLTTKEEALREIEKELYFDGITDQEYNNLKEAIQASTLPSDGTTTTEPIAES